MAMSTTFTSKEMVITSQGHLVSGLGVRFWVGQEGDELKWNVEPRVGLVLLLVLLLRDGVWAFDPVDKGVQKGRILEPAPC